MSNKIYVVCDVDDGEMFYAFRDIEAAKDWIDEDSLGKYGSPSWYYDIKEVELV